MSATPLSRLTFLPPQFSWSFLIFATTLSLFSLERTFFWRAREAYGQYPRSEAGNHLGLRATDGIVLRDMRRAPVVDSPYVGMVFLV
jgi:hypothetical protein